MNPLRTGTIKAYVFTRLHLNEHRWIPLRHVHHVRLARGHAWVGVAQRLLHCALAAGMQIAESGRPTEPVFNPVIL